MAHGHSLQHRNLVPDHMFASCHEALVNHLCGIVAPRVDMYAFLDNTVRARSECLASLVPARLDLRLRLRHPGLSCEVKSEVACRDTGWKDHLFLQTSDRVSNCVLEVLEMPCCVSKDG